MSIYVSTYWTGLDWGFLVGKKQTMQKSSDNSPLIEWFAKSWAMERDKHCILAFLSFELRHQERSSNRARLKSRTDTF